MERYRVRKSGEPPKDPNEIGKRILWLRRNYRLARLDLAQAIGVTDPVLSRYERGVEDIPAPLLKKIADYFHVSIASFFAESPTASSVLGREITAEERLLLSSFAKIRENHCRDAILHFTIAAREGSRWMQNKKR